MGFNQVENAFLGKAIHSLTQQYRRMGGKGEFGLGITPFMLMDDHGDGWRYLMVVGTFERSKDGIKYHPDPSYTPVKCYPPEPQGPTETTSDYFSRRGKEVGLPLKIKL